MANCKDWYWNKLEISLLDSHSTAKNYPDKTNFIIGLNEYLPLLVDRGNVKIDTADKVCIELEKYSKDFVKILPI